MKKTMIALLNSSVLLASLAAPAFASTYNVSGNGGAVNITDNSTTNITKNVTNITFNDLGNFGWAKKAIQDMVKQKLVNGVGNGKFAPEKEVTRAQFAVLVYRMFKLVAPDNTAQDFADVPTTLQNGKPNWAFKAIKAAAPYFDATTDLSTGGYDFNPNQPMTRQDVAVTLVKIMTKVGLIQMDSDDQVQEVLQNYTDVSDVPDSLQPYVATAITNGIMKGVSDTEFAPTQNVKRAEVAVLLERIKAKLTVVPGDTIQSMPPVPPPTSTDQSVTETQTQSLGAQSGTTDDSVTDTQTQSLGAPTSDTFTTVSNDTYQRPTFNEGPAGGSPANP